MKFANKQDIFKATNGGLEIILRLYPDAALALEKTNAKFKIRSTEKTASASLKDVDGIFYVTDFGGDSKARNGIDCWMKERGCDFADACRQISEEFGIHTTQKSISFKPKYTKKKAPQGTEPGIHYKSTSKVDEEELKSVLGRYVTKEAFEELGWEKVLHYQTVTKDGTVHQFETTEDYPIYVIDFGDFQKLYQPRAEKKHRFMYVGTRPKEFICGFRQLEQSQTIHEQMHPDRKDEKADLRLDKVIICSGETDALSVKSIGYEVLWMNSESDIMSGYQFHLVKQLAKKVYYLGDIDQTGKEQAQRWGLEHLELRLIKLPELLLKRRDSRGYRRKDVRDFLALHPKREFGQLLNTAYPFQFWDVVRTKEGVWRYKYNPAYAINLLRAHGFARLPMPTAKNEYVYIRIQGNTVSEVKTPEIKNFFAEFVQKRKLEVEVVNMVMQTSLLSPVALEFLPELDLDFSRGGKDYQYFFFPETTWKVTANEIEEVAGGDQDKYVWQNDVINPVIKGNATIEPKIVKLPFQVTKDGDQFDIKILDQSHPFMQFLINISRVHWKKELDTSGEDPYQSNEDLAKLDLNRIDGKLLTEVEVKEQKLHLINKLHALGYLMHSYKDPSRPWALWGMDDRVSEGSESHGRSGKSLFFNAVRQFLKNEYENGRNNRLTEKQHLFEGVTEHTDLIMIDDADKYMDFNYFYSWITGDMLVNPKHAKSFSLPFSKSPKIAFTSNFPPRNLDSSTKGRLYFTVNSDYYHEQSELHERARNVVDDLGIRLFDDFSKDQWSEFFMILAGCVQLSLRYHRVDPPMNTVTKRALMNVMGDSFYQWGKDYLMDRLTKPDEENEEAIQYINRPEAYEEFKKQDKYAKNYSTTRFKKSVEAWCKFYGFEFNPRRFQQGDGRVFKKIDGVKTECFVIIGERPSTYSDLPFMQSDDDENQPF